MSQPNEFSSPHPELGVLYHQRQEITSSSSLDLSMPKERSHGTYRVTRTSPPSDPFQGPRIIRSKPRQTTSRRLDFLDNGTSSQAHTPSTLLTPFSPVDSRSHAEESPLKDKVARNSSRQHHHANIASTPGTQSSPITIDSDTEDFPRPILCQRLKRKASPFNNTPQSARKKMRIFAGGVSNDTIINTYGVPEMIDLTFDQFARLVPTTRTIMATPSSNFTSYSSSPCFDVFGSSPVVGSAVEQELGRETPDSAVTAGSHRFEIKEGEVEDVQALVKRRDELLEDEKMLKARNKELMVLLGRTVKGVD